MELFRQRLRCRAFVVTVALAFGTTAWAQGPAVSITLPGFEYDEPAQSLREVDFRNFSYPALYESTERYTLRNGSYRDEAAGHLEVTENHVWRFGEYALVSLDVFSAGGSSSNDGLLYLFGLKSGRPAILQRFVFDLQAPGSGVWFNEKVRSLTIKTRSSDDSPHCCPKYLDIAIYAWNENRFELSKSQTVPVASK